ncbi:MAG: HEAT repeat domain-containing protein [Chloroflexi bacterium]|nr:HEAT repeat domain-containing protein [Chloroflexota bacterium]
MSSPLDRFRTIPGLSRIPKILQQAASLSNRLLPGRQAEIYRDSLISTLRYMHVVGKEGRQRSLDLLTQYVPPLLAPFDSMAGAREESEIPHPAAVTIWQALRVSPWIVLAGLEGSGKTSLLRYLGLLLAGDAPPVAEIHRLTFEHFDQTQENLIPFWVDLVAWAEDGHGKDQALLSFMGRSVQNLGISQGIAWVEEVLAGRQGMLLLDGYTTLALADQQRLSVELTQFKAKFPYNLLLLAAHPADQLPEIPKLVAWEIQPLTWELERTFVRSWFGKDKEKSNYLLQALERNRHLQAMASRPYLLAAMAAAEERHLELHETQVGVDGSVQVSPNGAVLPAEQHLPYIPLQDLHEQTLIILLGNVPNASETIDALSRAAFELHVQRLSKANEAFFSQFLPAAQIQQVVGSVVLRRLAGSDLAFGHSAQQEYLAARYIVNQGQLDMVLDQADDPWWREILVIASGLQRDATPLVTRLLGSGNEEHLYLAARCLAEAPNTQQAERNRVLDLLLDSFCHDNAEDWERAAVAITAISFTRRNEAFLHLLRSGTPDQQVKAAFALGRIGKDWGVTPLIAVLVDPNQELATAAVKALGLLHTSRAIRPLIGALGDASPDLRAGIAEALGRIGRPALQDLLRSLGDEREPVGAAIARALSLLGTIAVPPLIERLNSRHGLAADRATNALVKIGLPAVPALLEATNALDVGARRRAALALGEIGDPLAVTTLVAMRFAREPEIQQAVVQALVKIGPPAVPGMVAALDDERAIGSDRLAEAFALIGEPARAGLIAALTGSTRRTVRTRAALLLGEIRDESTVQALAAALKDERWEVRRRVVDALGRIGGTTAETALKAALRDEEISVRRRAAEVLGQMGTPGAVEALASALRDEDEVVREIAARMLGQQATTLQIEALIAALRDRDPRVRGQAAEALGRTQSPQAVRALIDAIVDMDPQVRESGGKALRNIGVEAIEPLIHAVYKGRNGDFQVRVSEVLGEIGRDLQLDNPDMSRLAALFYEMLRGVAAAEVATGLEEVTWWPHFKEFQLSFHTLNGFANYPNIETLAADTNALDWLVTINSWLRPQVRDLLLDFGRVAEYMRLYRSSHDRRDRLEALLNALDRMEDLERKRQQVINFQPENRLFSQAIQHWHDLLARERSRVGGGRAKLEVGLQSETVRMHGFSKPVALATEVTNLGDSAARNLRLRLRPSQNGEFELGEDSVQSLSPLGVGSTRIVVFNVKPAAPGNAELTFEATFADNEREDRFELFTSRVRFYTPEETYREISTNPYIPGPPVRTPDMFFGREDVFRFIQQNLSGTYQENVLLLYGQRRTGKTSTLYQLPHRFRNMLRPGGTADAVENETHYIFILIDMQYIPEVDTAGLLYEMARTITYNLEDERVVVNCPTLSEFQLEPFPTFRRFHSELEERLKQVAVIMIDEFDILLNKVREGVVSSDVFGFVRSLMQHSRHLAFIFTGTYELRQRQFEKESILFNTAKSMRISFLEEPDAIDLILKPVQGILEYHTLAVRRILDVTARHPFYIQYTCHTLVNLARRKQRNYIDLDDVKEALNETIRETAGSLRYDFDTITRQEKWALAALARETDYNKYFVGLIDIENTLSRFRLPLSRSELLDALSQLRDRDIVIERHEGQQLLYGIAMEILRIWLNQNEILMRLSEEVQ